MNFEWDPIKNIYVQPARLTSTGGAVKSSGPKPMLEDKK